MQLKLINEAHRFPNGREFDSDLTNVPFMSARKASKINVAYHYSDVDSLEKTGILTRSDMNLNDLFAAGLDSTHQNAVYLTTSQELQHVNAPYLYRVDLTNLDRSKFKADEDAFGHSSGFNDDSDWIGSIMCMGSFRYEASIPPQAVSLI